jgi:hypothetical protein
MAGRRISTAMAQASQIPTPVSALAAGVPEQKGLPGK